MTRTKIGLVVKKEATKPEAKVESAKVVATPAIPVQVQGKIEDRESHGKFVRNLFALVAF